MLRSAMPETAIELIVRLIGQTTWDRLLNEWETPLEGPPTGLRLFLQIGFSKSHGRYLRIYSSAMRNYHFIFVTTIQELVPAIVLAVKGQALILSRADPICHCMRDKRRKVSRW